MSLNDSPILAHSDGENTNTVRQQIRTTCAYCGVGCGVLATVDHSSGTVAVQGDPDHPANFGKLCSKGSALGNTLDVDRRLMEPLLHGQPVSWDEATDHIAERFSALKEQYGSDSIMLYVSGQLLTEDYYVANKFAKGFLGTNNIDSNSRLCMSSAVAGYKRAFGSDTVPCSYTDIEDSELFVIIGSNMAWCHPILFGRLKDSKASKPSKKVVVIDPRATDSTQIADIHLPIRSGTDTHLFNGLLKYLYENGHADGQYLAHCTGLEDALDACRPWNVAQVADVCGVTAEAINDFYALFANTEKAVSFYSMGVNQSSSGTDKVNSIINCHLLTGKIGYSGAGAFSITGQPNAMGGREVGALANLLASHFELKNSQQRAQVAEFWQAPQALGADDGIKAANVADAILEGRIKAIWIMATNPVVSLPEADKFARALSQCELVVVSDCSRDSDTLSYAHVALPAQGWSEKSGTVTNSERRISRQRRLLEPVGQAKPDWWIVSQVAKKMGYVGFDYAQEADVFAEHLRLSGYNNQGTRSFDVSCLLNDAGGMDRQSYDDLSPFQWGDDHYFSKEQLLAGQVYTDDRRLHLIPITPRLPQSEVDDCYPLRLNTGRLRDQWHTMTRTGIAPQLNQHLPQPFVAIHPRDAEKCGVAHQDLVRVSSAHGSIVVRAHLTEQQRVGDLFSPMHWNNHFTKDARVGKLIHSHVDPVSQQPEFKHTPVQLTRVPVVGVAKLLLCKPVDDFMLRWLDTEAPSYWVRNRQQYSSDYLCAIDGSSALTPHWFTVNFWQQHLSALLTQTAVNPNGLDMVCDQSPFEFIQYIDDERRDVRVAVLHNNQLQAVVFVSNDEQCLPNHSWLDGLFAEPLDDLQRKWLLAGRAASGFVDVGRIICSCMTVGENTILDTIQNQGCKTAADVGKHCKAGTNCGSCVSEINALLEQQTVPT